MLKPLQKTLKSLGVYLLKLPHAGIRPGAVLNAQGEVIQHLTDLRWRDTDFFAPLGTVTLSEPIQVDAVVDEYVHRTQVGASLGAGLPNLASVKAGIEVSTHVKIEVGPLVEVKLQNGLDSLGEPNYLEGMDFADLASAQGDFVPFINIRDRMMNRVNYWPTPREVNLVQALVYAESLSFTFYNSTGVSVGAEAPVPIAAGLLDIEAGLDVGVEGKGKVIWQNGTKIPLGFRPVRYAWRPRKKRFTVATF